jgi:hypothetical protein
LDPKQNREFSHNNKEFQIAIKDRTNGGEKNTHTHTQLTTKDCPSVKTDCDAKGQTGGVVTFVAIALSPLGSVTRGHERTNSARARSAGGGSREVADSAARALYCPGPTKQIWNIRTTWVPSSFIAHLNSSFWTLL